jgi:hypothetical protein
VLEKVRKMIIDDVGRVTHLHCGHFLSDFLQSSSFVQLDNFDSVNHSLVKFGAGFINFTHGAFANFLNEVVSLSWIFLSDFNFRKVQSELICSQKFVLFF